MEFTAVKVSQNLKFDVKYFSIVIATYQVRAFKCN